MFLAPPLPAAQKRRGRLFRIASGLGLGAAATLLLATNLVLALAVFYSVDPKVSSQELYHRTWEQARDNYYDQSKLANWQDWEHKFDGQIHTDEDAIRFANEMLRSLDDRYTFLLDPASVLADQQRAKGQFIGIGISLQSEPGADGHLLVGRVFPGSPAEAAGIKYGDAIVDVDGRPAAGFTSEQAVAALRGDPSKVVSLTIRRNGQTVALTVARAPINIPLVTVKRLDGNIGYIRLESFDQWDTADEMTEAMRQLSDCPALVIDVRDNPGGFIHSALAVSALFLEDGTITTERMRLPNGRFLTS